MRNLYLCSMKKITLVFMMAGTILLSSCDILSSVANQVNSVSNLANCEFNLKNVNNVSVAGVNVKNLSQGKLSATDVVKLVAAYQTKKVPLSMDVNVDIKNPTTQQAAMTSLDWILAISSKVGLRVKPSINVAGTQVPFPNYIKLEKKTGKV